MNAHRSEWTRRETRLSLQSAEKRPGQVRRTNANPCEPKRASSATENATDLLPSDPDLRRVVEAWERLSGAIRQGIMAMVKASELGVEVTTWKATYAILWKIADSPSIEALEGQRPRLLAAKKQLIRTTWKYKRSRATGGRSFQSLKKREVLQPTVA